MGGCVAIVLKEPSGTVHKMLRWTNPLPTSLIDPGLYAADPAEWIAGFMEYWLKMRQDFELHRDDGQFALGQTTVYFPWDVAAPSEYGIILIDLQSKQIHSMQNYCMEPYAVDLQLLHVYETDPDRTANIKGLLANGAISKMHIKNGDAGEWRSLRFKTAGDPEALDRAWNNLVALSRELRNTRAVLEISPPGFVIQGHQDTLEGGLAFKKALSESRIPMGETDDADWRTWAERRDGSEALKEQFGITPARKRNRP